MLALLPRGARLSRLRPPTPESLNEASLPLNTSQKKASGPTEWAASQCYTAQNLRYVNHGSETLRHGGRSTFCTSHNSPSWPRRLENSATPPALTQRRQQARKTSPRKLNPVQPTPSPQPRPSSRQPPSRTPEHRRRLAIIVLRTFTQTELQRLQSGDSARETLTDYEEEQMKVTLVSAAT